MSEKTQLVPEVTEELKGQINDWNKEFRKYSRAHNEIAFEENKLLAKERDSIMSPDAVTFEEEDTEKLLELSLKREIVGCKLMLCSSKIQELRNKYMLENTDYKLVGENNEIK